MHDVTDEANALSRLLVPHSTAVIAQIVTDRSGTSVSGRSVDGWKAGRSLPRVELLEALAAAIDVDLQAVRDAYTRSRMARRQKRRTARIPPPVSRRRAVDAPMWRAS